MKLTVSVSIISIASKYMAATQLGGFTIRGRSAATEVLAVRNLFFVLAGETDNDDTNLAVELALSGTTLDMALLDAGPTA
jgi:hypothetical protein